MRNGNTIALVIGRGSRSFMGWIWWKKDASRRADFARALEIDASQIVALVSVEPLGEYRREMLTSSGGSSGIGEMVFNEVFGELLSAKQLRKDEETAEALGIELPRVGWLVLWPTCVEVWSAEKIYGPPLQLCARWSLSSISNAESTRRGFHQRLKLTVDGAVLVLVTKDRDEALRVSAHFS